MHFSAGVQKERSTLIAARYLEGKQVVKTSQNVTEVQDA